MERILNLLYTEDTCRQQNIHSEMKEFMMSSFPFHSIPFIKEPILTKEHPQYSQIHNPKTDISIAVPNGKKWYLWIVHSPLTNTPVVVFIQFNQPFFTQHTQITHYEMGTYSFHHELVYSNGTQTQDNTGYYGTLLSGVFFEMNSRRHFSCMDIHYYKGQNMSRFTWKDKFECLDTLFTHSFNPIPLLKHGIFIGLPIMTSSFHSMLQELTHIPYEVYQFRILQSSSKSSQMIGVMKNKPTQLIYAQFQLKATIEEDIYTIYDSHHKFVGYACIPDYKTSCMMNTYFRKIKENQSLDALEESDDEDEFENTSPDKFIKNHGFIPFKCIYSWRHKQWKPIECIDLTSSRYKLTSIQQIQPILDKYKNTYLTKQNKH
jgi:hypothetical protein